MSNFVGGDDSDSYDQSSTIRNSACGEKSPFHFTSSKERIWIRFKSDSFRSERGFVAGYVMYESSKSLTSFSHISQMYIGKVTVYCMHWVIILHLNWYEIE